MSDDTLLSVGDLKKHYPVRSGLLRRVSGHVKAVDGVSFDVHRGETLGLVGESGCGKSTTARTVLQLEEPTAGEVRFDGDDVTEHTGAERRQFRRRTGVVFQDPNSAFDPRMTVGESVREPLEIHGLRDENRGEEIVAELFEHVGLSAGDVDRYPDAFSDGQKQRIALARALVLNPDLLVADEPVSALDVSVQADVLSLIDDLQSELDLSMLFISHDLSVVRQVCDRVGVMYLGEIVEVAETEALFSNPQHPYTEALLASIPDPDPRDRDRDVRLTGDVPDPANPPDGCSFHTRCPRVIAPADYPFDDDTFRSVLDFRLAVENDDVDAAGDGDEAAVREAYDLPESGTAGDDESGAAADPGPDDDASALAAAVEAVADGDVPTAADRLEGRFVTECEQSDPALRETDAGHSAACHLHDPEHDAPGLGAGDDSEDTSGVEPDGGSTDAGE